MRCPGAGTGVRVTWFRAWGLRWFFMIFIYFYGHHGIINHREMLGWFDGSWGIFWRYTAPRVGESMWICRAFLCGQIVFLGTWLHQKGRRSSDGCLPSTLRMTCCFWISFGQSIRVCGRCSPATGQGAEEFHPWASLGAFTLRQPFGGKGPEPMESLWAWKKHRFRDSCSDISIINVYVCMYIYIYIYIYTYISVCMCVYIYTVYFLCVYWLLFQRCTEVYKKTMRCFGTKFWWIPTSEAYPGTRSLLFSKH